MTTADTVLCKLVPHFHAPVWSIQIIVPNTEDPAMAAPYGPQWLPPPAKANIGFPCMHKQMPIVL